jgi:glycosyltransferase involved in cell wall biosynthesis
MARRLALVIHALNTGGAERVLVDMANHWCQQGHDITLITLDTDQTDAFPLHPNVRRIGLGLLRPSRSLCQALYNNAARVRGLRRAIASSGAPCVISFTDKMNVLTLLASISAPWAVVIAERNDPRRQWMGRLWEWLRRRMYPRCDALVVQTEAVAACAAGLVHPRPVYVIPNAVRRPEFADWPQRRAAQVVAMGRLTAQKGFDLLLQAFARIAGEHPNWTLHIVGEGAARGELVQLADTLQIADRVHWAGWVAQPESMLRHSSIFVLSSRYEGFPNALLEAMSCGLACVSFACDSGPAEILEHGVSGLLLPPEDVSALALALDQLISDEAERQRLGAGAYQAAGRFDEEQFFRRWDQVLDEAALRDSTAGCRHS